jgi:CMP-N-acetylneuraminic acid synthetase
LVVVAVAGFQSLTIEPPSNLSTMATPGESSAIQITIDERDPRLMDMVSTAVLSAIDQKSKDALIQEAIKSLLSTPPASLYSSTPRQPNIQRIFSDALESLARKEAEKVFAESQEIKDLFAEQLGKLKKLDYDTRQKVLQAFTGALIETLANA